MESVEQLPDIALQASNVHLGMLTVCMQTLSPSGPCNRVVPFPRRAMRFKHAAASSEPITPALDTFSAVKCVRRLEVSISIISDLHSYADTTGMNARLQMRCKEMHEMADTVTAP